MRKNRLGSRRLFLKSSTALVITAFGSIHGQERDAAPVKVGLPQSMFRDHPPALVKTVLPAFTYLLEKQTGIKGEPVLLIGPDEVRKQLADGKIQLAVFHGFEYAWAQAKNPELKPLVMAVNQNSKLTAQIIVPTDSKVSKLEDLQGKHLAIPKGTREHCWLFTRRRTQGLGHRMEKFFSRITNPPNVGAALDDVAAGKVDATVVEGAAWDSYKWAQPARARRLRTLMQSEPFPAGVIVYRENGLSNDSLLKVRNGLRTAHETADGQRMIMLLKLSRFDDVSTDYQETLNNIRTAYPPPIHDE